MPMSDSMHSNASLRKRLLPLYAAAFFHGFVFWYPIEKLFMKSIGYNDASIGFMVAFYSVIMLLAETPSGILADRWSRKGVLILASISLALSALIGGLSDSVIVYLIATGFWGLFFAFFSGTYESIIYDTLLEYDSGKGQFTRYYGWVKVSDSIALVIGSLLGGLLANYFGLRFVYFATVPVAVFSIIALIKFKEPRLHRPAIQVSIKAHVATTFKAVLKRDRLLPIMVVLVTAATLTYMLFEFSQLWVIALTAPIVLLGAINALVLSTIGLGGAAAGLLKLHKYPVMFAALLLMILCTLGLILSRNLVVTVVSMTLLGLCLIGIHLVFTRLLHDSLDSQVRAGAASAVSTLGRLIIIPLALLFGFISNRNSVFHASWLLLVIVLIIVIFVSKTYTDNKTLPDMTSV